MFIYFYYFCLFLGPKPERSEVTGLDDAGVLPPVARLLENSETKPSHVYDDLSETGPRPGK